MIRSKGRLKFIAVMLSLAVVFTMSAGSGNGVFAATSKAGAGSTQRIGVAGVESADSATAASGAAGSEKQEQITLTPGGDGSYVAQLIGKLGGDDGLYKEGLNGFDMYDNLGYVYMGWRTTGGIWQNQVIGSFIMKKLKEAGYTTTDANVEAPYGTKPASDKSDVTDSDYAWEIQYQGTSDKDLGSVWDPEYASLEVQLTGGGGKTVKDTQLNEQVEELTEKIGGKWWSYNPATEVYQKNFAQVFGMDYENDIAALPTTDAKVKAMHDVLMTPEANKDYRKGCGGYTNRKNRNSEKVADNYNNKKEQDPVDNYKYIKRDSIDKPNLEAVLNQRTKLAWNSCFTDPAGTDPAEAKGTEGEFIYVGTVAPSDNSNSEGIAAEDIAGKVILTDSGMWSGFAYAKRNGAVGVASKRAVEGFLCPRDNDGNIRDPWYDSARYHDGGNLEDTKALTEEGKPIVEWQFSNRQYDSLRTLLKIADEKNKTIENDADKYKVTAKQIAIGQCYPMTKTEGKPGKGQAVAIAEVKGSVHPEKRIMICAHVQEPGCNDNATGVASLLGIATAYKKMVDEGKIAKPKCTITFMWGDETNMAGYWMDGHPEETKNLIGALDMDMTGEDPEKTGGVMRIEKTPDPSATGGYTVDAVPWDEPDKSIPSLTNPYYDETYKNKDGAFVRLPDSHTLWGEEEIGNIFKSGWYLNDLYMYVTSTVIGRHDPIFKVNVCPYEGGSDHTDFLEKQIPALLTWHFTDYTYHTSSDTLYMASPRELESVGLTTLATGLMMGDLCDDSKSALEVLGAVREAGLKRMEAESFNADHHKIYADANGQEYAAALANEAEVLDAWGEWYGAAASSVLSLVDTPSDELKEAVNAAEKELDAAKKEAVRHAEKVFGADEESKPDDESAKKARQLAARIAAAKKAVVKGLKVKSKNRRFIVKWRASKGVSGYQVVYKKKSAKKYRTLKFTRKTKVITRKLKKGRKYRFRVRAYTKINGKKVYGPYTKARTVKCK